MGVDELVHAGGGVHAEELIEDVGVVDVGVAHRVGVGVGPPERQVEHRPVVAVVHRAALRLRGAVGLQHLDLDVGGGHRLGVGAVLVAGGVAGHE